MKYRTYLDLVLTLILGLLATSSLRGQSSLVLREPPAVYEEKLQELMTPLESLLEASDEFDPQVSDGATLLNEDIFFVEDSGKIYELRQRSYIAVTDADVDDVSEEIHSFRPLMGEKIYLIRAVTIQPDGTEMSLGEQGAFVQTPQREANSKIYSGTKEMKLILPRVERGSITHTIVLIEHEQGRIAGEFTDGSSWASGWPRKKQRVLVEMPKDWAERLTVATKGQVLEATKTALPEENRMRFEWVKNDIPVRRWEKFGGYAFDNGPYLRLSTLPDWDAFAIWYAGQLGQAAELTPELKEEVQQWTANAQDRDEIIAILYEKAAREIRYTSINFGNGGFVPQACGSLWENKFGDCKDKSNFLRLLLAEKGIKAHIALLNTSHLGAVDPRTPDYRYFDHAIVAVENEDGGYSFLDPTLSYGLPGYLSPYSSDREILVVDTEAGKGVWSRTPKNSAGLAYADLDLTLETNGTLSGWLDYGVKGYYSSGSKFHYRSEDRVTLRDKVRSLVRRYYPDAEVVDFEVSDIDNGIGEFAIKAYFVDAGSALDPKQSNAVRLPDFAWMLPYAGEEKEITRDAFIWPETFRTHVDIQLPNGWSPVSLPASLSVSAYGFEVAAHYAKQADGLTLSMEGEMSESRVSPAQFTPLYNALKSMTAWLGNPVILKQGESEEGETAGAKPDALGNFPMMPTGEGQLKLALEKYPRDRDVDLYCQALERVIQYFPEDGATVFRAKIRLCWVDWDLEHEEKALRDIRELLNTYRGVLDSEDIGWGEYLEALCLRDLDRKEEALAKLREIANNEKYSDFRRGWAEYGIGLILEADNPSEAINCLERAVAFDSGDEAYHFQKLAEILLEQGQVERMVEILNGYIQDYPDFASGLLNDTAETGITWLGGENAGLVEPLLQVLRNVNAAEVGGPELAQKMQEMQDAVEVQSVYRSIQSDLAQYIEQHPPTFWEATTPDEALTTREGFLQAVEDFNEARDKDQSARHALETILRFEPNNDFPYLLWRCAVYLEWRERDEGPILDSELHDKILTLGERLPPTSDSYFDLLFFRGYYYRNRGEYEREIEVYDRIQSQVDSDAWNVSLNTRKGIAAQNAGQYELAADTFVQLLPTLDRDASSVELLNRAVIIYLELGKTDEAIELLGELSKVDVSTLEESDYNTQFADLQTLSAYDEGQGMLEYWQHTAAWWPQWQAIEAQLSAVRPPENELTICVYSDLTAAGQTLVRTSSGDQSQFLEYFSLLIHLARWQPEANALITQNSRLFSSVFPEVADEWRKLALEMYESFPKGYDFEYARDGMVWYVLDLIGLSETEEAMSATQSYYTQYDDDSVATESMNRLYGLLAAELNQDLETAEVRLEKDLASGMTLNRANSVYALAGVYRKQGKTDKEKELLEVELKNPVIQSNDQYYPQFVQRAEALSLEGKTSKDFAQAVDAWLKKHQPAWYEFAEPHGLDDYRLRNLSKALENPDLVFSDLEVIKLGFLACRSDELDLQQKIDQFNHSVLLLLQYTLSPEMNQSMVVDIIDNPQFPEQQRLFWLFMGMYDGAMSENIALFETLRQNPAFDDLSDDNKQKVESLAQLLEVDRASIDSVSEYCDELLAKGNLNYTELVCLDYAFDWLLDMGQYEAASQVYRQTKNITLGADVSMTHVAFRLSLLRRMNACKEMEKLHEVYRNGMLPLLSEEVGASVEASQRWLNLDEVSWLSNDQAFEILAYRLRADNFPRAGISFWQGFFGSSMYYQPEDKIALREVLADGVRAADSDALRADALGLFFMALDFDDPEVRDYANDFVSQWRSDSKSPISSAMIKANDFQCALRLGEAMDVEERSVEVDYPNRPLWEEQRVISYYIREQNRPQLEHYLKQLGAEQLMSHAMIDLTLQAFQMAGMEEERMLAVEEAERYQYESVLFSWQTKDFGIAAFAMNLAMELGDAESLPPEWMTAVQQACTGVDQTIFELLVAEVDDDWPSAEAAARKLTQELPTFYEYYWRLGRALYKQGKVNEAVEPLKVYTHYSKDTTEYRLANEMLADAQPQE